MFIGGDHLDKKLYKLIKYYRLYAISHERSKNNVHVLRAKLNETSRRNTQPTIKNDLNTQNTGII